MSLDNKNIETTEQKLAYQLNSTHTHLLSVKIYVFHVAIISVVKKKTKHSKCVLKTELEKRAKRTYTAAGGINKTNVPHSRIEISGNEQIF